MKPHFLSKSGLEDIDSSEILFIGICTSDSSGCHSFCKCCADTMPDSQYIKFNTHEVRLIVPEPSKFKSEGIRAIVLSGCVTYLSTLVLEVKKIVSNDFFSKLEYLIFIRPPHLAIASIRRSFTKLQSLQAVEESINSWVKEYSQASYQHTYPKMNPNLQIKVEQCSIFPGCNDLGIPCLISQDAYKLITDPLPLIGPNTCGLVYAPRTFPKRPLVSFDNIFKLIVEKNSFIKTPHILMIDESEPHQQAEFKEHAATFNITLDFHKKITVKNEFHSLLIALSNIKDQRVVSIMCDGVMTLLEAFKLGLNVIITNQGSSHEFYTNLIMAVNPNIMSVAVNILAHYCAPQDPPLSIAEMQALKQEIGVFIEAAEKRFPNNVIFCPEQQYMASSLLPQIS